MAYTSDYYYDVFINHRGPDVKKGFAGHLYRSLCSHGIRVFLDKPEMRKGDNLNYQIVSAIKTASVQVAIFSENYALSKWCLLELVLMWESLKTGATIIPVFYKVKPSDIRWTEDIHKGYGKGLHQLKLETDEVTIKQWRDVLSEVSHISGFELEAYFGEEGELIEKIVESVSKIVKKSRFSVFKYEKVGLDVKVKDFEDKVLSQFKYAKVGLDVKVKDFEDKVLSQPQQSEKSQVVGIAGIAGLGGVGKTTLAKELFRKKLSSYFNSCFFTVTQNASRSSLNSLFGEVLKRLTRSDMQMNSVDQVQKLFEKHEPSLEMIQKYTSLVIVDGVDNVDQCEELLKIQVVLPNSLILVTSRDIDVLTSSGVEQASIYKLSGLDTQNSRKLFCFSAFHRASPPLGYEYLVEEFLTVCEGLPLLLQVIGAFFYEKKDRSYWEDQLDRFQQILPRDIEKKLKLSYYALNIEEKQIFLDIARIFIGERTDTAIRIWKGSGLRGLLGFQSLLEKRLVEVDDSENCINMHDCLKDLGETIAEETRLPRPLWPKTDNNADSLQESPVLTELRRNIADLLQQSSVIKEVRGFMLMILIMMSIAIMIMMAIIIWSIPRSR